MALGQPFDVQDVLPTVSWRQVVEINPAKFSPEEIQKIESALDEIEGTRAGQTLLRGMQIKQAKEKSEKVQLIFSNETVAAYGTMEGRHTIVLNPQKLDTLVFHLPTGQAVKPALSEVLFHEAVHYVDNNLEPLARAYDALERHKKQHGELVLLPDKEKMVIAPNSAFLEALPIDQREALLSLREAKNNKTLTVVEFETIFAEKMEILRANPQLEKLHQSSITLQDGMAPDKRAKAEFLAMSGTNPFTTEINGPYQRVAYGAGNQREQNRAIPVWELHPINIKDKIEAWDEAKAWEEQYGDATMHGHRLQVPDLNSVVPASVKEAMGRNGIRMDAPIDNPFSLSSIGTFPQLSYSDVNTHGAPAATPHVTKESSLSIV